jgi:hypothetical protein
VVPELLKLWLILKCLRILRNLCVILLLL